MFTIIVVYYVQGRKAVGELGSVVQGRSMSMEVKRDLRNSII